ncbi:MAG: [FeFe] hydrogenase, group A [Oscillospiraceae bacterium]|nr:[FeFe] hydrogenase, group A [Oscillospiraceae bacterium]
MQKEFRAACRGCHGGCVHILTVENGRVVRVRPDPEAPLNQGHACPKGISIIEQMYHPDRLLHPMKRIGPRGSGKWEQISWDEALDTIAARLGELSEKYGAECISAITGTGRHLVPYLWRFTRALGTPNITSAGALICLGPRKNAGFSTSGTYGCVDYYGETRPKCIVVWGANPTTSGADGELQWHPRRCAQEGTKLIVIDPQYTEAARHAELWLRLRPGTDGALALGLINIIISEDLYDHEFVEKWTYGFEQLRERCAAFTPDRVERTTWIPKEQLYAAARMMARETPMSLEWGCAVDQCFNSTQTCRAIYMLPALLGSYDVPGGFVESKHIVPTKRDPITPSDKLINDYPCRYLKPYAHPHEVLDAIRMERPYKIRAMLSFANNALISLPDSKRVCGSLEELEFFVCMDVFMTPTAELADIVLPAALWPEVNCVFTMPEFAEHTILCQQKVAQVGECRSDEEVFIGICRRMGLDYGAESQTELLDTELAEMSTRFPELKGMTFDKLSRLGYYTPERTYRNYEKRGGFPTPTGKFEFYSKELEECGGDPLPDWIEPPTTPVSRPDLKREFPYILTTGGRRQQYFISNNRQIVSLRRMYPFPLVRMHPATAAKHGIAEGDWVYIRTFRGRITQKAKLEPDMDERVINCDFGWWYPEAGAPDYGWTESNANILTSCDNGCDGYMGSYQLRTLLCTIYKNNDCHIEERYYASKLYSPPAPDFSSPSVEIDRSRCELCGECVRTCRDVQGIGVLEIVTVNGETLVRTKRGGMLESGCVGCGQCRVACAYGALRIKSDIERFQSAAADPETMVVVQIAPSVRVGLGGQLGFAQGENALPYIVGALRQLGADRVLDTVVSADLTVIEESNEFLDRLQNGGRLPLLTSCCPAWVKFCEEKYPELAANISTCRSPQQMLGAVLQEWYADPAHGDGRRVVSVSIMPCTAKKAEILRSESMTHGRQDVNIALTTSELIEMMHTAGLTRENCPTSAADDPFALGSGGGTIFGATGGVTEAVLRYLSPKLGFKDFSWIERSGVRGSSGIKTASVEFSGGRVNIAVVSGLANAARVLEQVKSGQASYDLIEVMACPGGCVMGGGQVADNYETLRSRDERSDGLYHIDSVSVVAASQQNTQAEMLYATVLKGREHELLHRSLSPRRAESA